MKYKKVSNKDEMSLTIHARNAFCYGKTEPVDVESDELPESFRFKYFFGYELYNKKRNVYDCWKQLYRLEFNDDICYWNGKEE